MSGKESSLTFDATRPQMGACCIDWGDDCVQSADIDPHQERGGVIDKMVPDMVVERLLARETH